MKLREAVMIALGELGDKTSLEFLQKRAEELAGDTMTYQYVYQIRRIWRKDIAGGLKTD